MGCTAQKSVCLFLNDSVGKFFPFTYQVRFHLTIPFFLFFAFYFPVTFLSPSLQYQEDRYRERHQESVERTTSRCFIRVKVLSSSHRFYAFVSNICRDPDSHTFRDCNRTHVIGQSGFLFLNSCEYALLPSSFESFHSVRRQVAKIKTLIRNLQKVVDLNQDYFILPPKIFILIEHFTCRKRMIGAYAFSRIGYFLSNLSTKNCHDY